MFGTDLNVQYIIQNSRGVGSRGFKQHVTRCQVTETLRQRRQKMRVVVTVSKGSRGPFMDREMGVPHSLFEAPGDAQNESLAFAESKQ